MFLLALLTLRSVPPTTYLNDTVDNDTYLITLLNDVIPLTPLEKESLCSTVMKQTKSKKVTANSSLPLFNEFPNLKNTIAHSAFGSFPTPIEKLSQLGFHLKQLRFYQAH